MKLVIERRKVFHITALHCGILGPQRLLETLQYVVSKRAPFNSIAKPQSGRESN